MPIEQVIEKYQSGVVSNPNIKKLQGNMPNSPYLRARKTNEPGCSSSSSGLGSSSVNLDSAGSSGCSSKIDSKCDTSSDVNIVSSSISDEKKENGSDDATQTNHIENVVTTSVTNKDCTSPDSSNTIESKNEAENKDVKTEINGEIHVGKTDNVSSSTTTQENGEVTNSSPKGKGKGKMIKKISESQKKLRARTLRIRNAHQLYTKLLDMEESDSEDENDETFDGGEDFSSSELENDVGDCDSDADDENDNASEDEELEDDSEELEDEDEEDEVDDEDDEFARNIREEPGSDSGCTAVVAVVNGDKVYVANAGKQIKKFKIIFRKETSLYEISCTSGPSPTYDS